MDKYRVKVDSFRKEYNYPKYYVIVKNEVVDGDKEKISAGSYHERNEETTHGLSFDDIIEFAFKYVKERGGTKITIKDHEPVKDSKRIKIVEAEGKPCEDKNKLTFMISQADKDGFFKAGFTQCQSNFIEKIGGEFDGKK